MREVLSVLGTAILLTACATGPEPVETAAPEKCYSQDRPTGSNIVRRDTCVRSEPAKATGKS